MVLARNGVLGLTMAFAAAAFAGCLGATDGDAQLEAEAPLMPDLASLIGADHDHRDRALHNHSWNVHKMGWSSGYLGDAPASASYNELAVKCGYVFLGRGASGGGGFSIIDVSDPAAPTTVGEWAGEGTFDIEVDDACDYAYVATQRNCAPGSEGEPSSHLPRGLHIVNVHDKTRPVWENYYPMPPNGVHTNAYFRTEAGRELMILNTYDLTSSVTGCAPVASPLPFGALPATHRVEIAEIGVTGGKKSLRPLSSLSLPGAPLPGQGDSWFPHDSFVQVHPLTGKTLLYVAYWDAGLRIYDITDPADPTAVGSFTDFAPSALKSLHYAEAFAQLIDGKHITVTAPEIPSGEEAGQFTVLDTTDPANPVKLGHWTLPGGPYAVSGFNFSPHNFDLQNGRIYLAYNHGGAWALDVSTAENLADPKPVGAWLHADEMPDKDAQAPHVWGVFWVDGFVYASDTGTGLYVLHVAGDAIPEKPAEPAMAGHQH